MQDEPRKPEAAHAPQGASSAEPSPAPRASPAPGLEQVGYEPPKTSLGLLVLDLVGMFALALPLLGLLAIVVGLMTALMGPLFGVLMVFVLMLGMVLIGAAARRMKRERGVTLLGYLEVATRMNLPLPDFLDTLGQGEGKAIGVRARRMSWALREGRGLGEAVCRHGMDIPAPQAAVIWRGEQVGRLREAVARTVDRLRRDSRDTRTTRNDSAMQYALLVMVVLLGLLGLVGAFIIPKYEEIFNDFDADFPAITRLTFQWGAVFSPVLVLASVAALLALVGWATYGLIRDSQAVGGPLGRVLEPVRWRMPVLSNSYRSAAWADACFMIEQAMRAGQPLPDAIELAGHPAISGTIDRRLRRFAQSLRAGQSMPDAARHAKLPTLVVGMLGTAGAAHRPADTFAYLSRYYTHRVSPAEQVLRATAMPLATLALASAVAWFVFALFYPLVVLIEQTLEYTGYA